VSRDFGEIADESQKHVTLLFERETLDELSLGLSDLLCWCAGFNSALGENGVDRAPLGVQAVRTLNIKIKSALSAKGSSI
jgi:hypothetical protein